MSEREIDPEGFVREGNGCICGPLYTHGGHVEPGQFDPDCPYHSSENREGEIRVARYGRPEQAVAEFDAMLADAWDEGYDAGDRDARAVQATYPAATANPYRRGVDYEAALAHLAAFEPTLDGRTRRIQQAIMLSASGATEGQIDAFVKAVARGRIDGEDLLRMEGRIG